MLLDECPAERDARDRTGIIKRMVGKPDHRIKAACHVSESAQIIILGGCGIAADAMQYGKLGASTVTGGRNRFADLLVIRHARGDDHRFARASDEAEDRKSTRL